MIFFGHVGITLGVIQTINYKIGKTVDLRKAAVLAVAPDLLDKPLGLLYPKIFENNTRLYAHSLVFAVFVLLVFWLFRKTLKNPIILWGAYCGHLALDKMWVLNREILFWPFLGKQPPYPGPILAKWAEALTKPYSVSGETIGLSILFFLIVHYRLYIRSHWNAFKKTGLLTEDMAWMSES